MYGRIKRILNIVNLKLQAAMLWAYLGAIVAVVLITIFCVLMSPLAIWLTLIITSGLGASIGLLLPVNPIEEENEVAPDAYEIFNPVVDVGVPEPDDVQRQRIQAENNRLLVNLPENEEIELLSDNEIATYKEYITTLNEESKSAAKKKLSDYKAYVSEPCILNAKSKHDADFNPLTIEGDYREEGQPSGRRWVATYHTEDFQKYIQSCNAHNKPALAPHSRDPLNDPSRIKIYKGFMSSMISFILNVRETLQQLHTAKAPDSKRQIAIKARQSFYAQLFQATKSQDATISSVPIPGPSHKM